MSLGETLAGGVFQPVPGLPVVLGYFAVPRVMEKAKPPLGERVPLLGCEGVPLDGLAVVRWNVLAVLVDTAKGQLGVGVALFGGQP